MCICLGVWKVHAEVTKIFTWRKCVAVKVVFECDYRRKAGGNEFAGVAWAMQEIGSLEVFSREHICKHVFSINLIFISIHG